MLSVLLLIPIADRVQSTNCCGRDPCVHVCTVIAIQLEGHNPQ